MPDPMPLPMTGKAPRFSPDIIGFKTFFDNVTDLASRCAITESEAIDWAIRYAGSHAIGWDRAPTFRKAAADRKLADFRSEILLRYPTLDPDSQYTIHELDALAYRYNQRKDMSREAYGDYQRAFAACAGFLQDKNRLSAVEAGRVFLRGLPDDLHDKVLARLSVRRLDANPDDGYDMADLEEAALYVLRFQDRDRRERTRRDDPPSAGFVTKNDLDKVVSSIQEMFVANVNIQPASSNPPRRSQNPAPGGAVQSAPRWAPQRPQQTQGYQNQPTPQRSQQAPGSQNQQVQQRPQQGQTFQNQPRTCLFCGEQGHYIGECMAAQEYLDTGKIIRNEEWRLVLPSGRYVPRMVPGRTIKEKVDNYYRQQGQQDQRNNGPDTISANFLESADTAMFTLDIQPVEGPPDVRFPSSSDLPSSTFSSSSQDADLAEKIQILEAQIESLRGEAAYKGKGKERFDGVHVPAKPKYLSKKENDPAPASTSKSARVSDEDPQPRPQNPARNLYYPPKSGPDDPQYHIKAAVESSATTQKIVDRALDAPITVSTRELLASSSDARKYLKDVVSSKKVAAHIVERDDIDAFLSTFTAIDPVHGKTPEDCSTAAISLPLRVIHPTFAPGFSPECILDGGAQAVIIRKDVWERLGVPLSTDKRMKMESASAGTTMTIGVVENYPVQFGNIVIYLQLQVVEDAPFYALLGRPFFDVICASEVSEPGGNHKLFIRDPVSGESFRVATHARNQKTPRLNFQA